jgi:hypothetical protein
MQIRAQNPSKGPWVKEIFDAAPVYVPPLNPVADPVFTGTVAPGLAVIVVPPTTVVLPPVTEVVPPITVTCPPIFVVVPPITVVLPPTTEVMPPIVPTSDESEFVVKVTVLPPTVPTKTEWAVTVLPPTVPTKAEFESVLNVTVVPPTVPTNAEYEFVVTCTVVPPIVAIKEGFELRVTVIPPYVATGGSVVICWDEGMLIGGRVGWLVGIGCCVICAVFGAVTCAVEAELD